MLQRGQRLAAGPGIGPCWCRGSGGPGCLEPRPQCWKNCRSCGVMKKIYGFRGSWHLWFMIFPLWSYDHLWLFPTSTNPFPAPCHPYRTQVAWLMLCFRWPKDVSRRPSDVMIRYEQLGVKAVAQCSIKAPEEFRLLLAKISVYFCFQRCQGACQVQAARFRRSWNVLGKMFEALWAVRAGSQMESATKESSHVWPAFIPSKAFAPNTFLVRR